MKKKDWILITVILAIAGIFFVLHITSGRIIQGKAEVYVAGKIYGTYDLSKEQKIVIQDSNVLMIKDGRAQMESADCPDQICVRQKAISKEGESIICLPNKVVVSIVGGEEKELDAVTN